MKNNKINNQTDKWLVTGASGLLGSNFAEVLRTEESIPVLCTSTLGARSMEMECFDIRDTSKLLEVVKKHKPTHFFHAAAISTIEGCKSDKVTSYAINTQSAINASKIARDFGMKFIFISTDAVFDGLQGGYSELSSVNPQTHYGETKAKAEQGILDSYPEALIARVNFFGNSPNGKRSIAEYFLNSLSAAYKTPGFTDQIVSTMYVRILSKYLLALSGRNANGIFHVASENSLSKFEFGRLIAKEFGLDVQLVQETTTLSVLQESRGTNLSLDISKLKLLLGEEIPTVESSIKNFAQDTFSGQRPELQKYYLENK